MEVAGRGVCQPWWEVEALHRDLALAPPKARAGERSLEHWKGLSAGSLEWLWQPLGLGQMGSGNDCGQD